MSSSSDPPDDVDRLFACFKCGLSTPDSAMQVKMTSGGSRRRRSFVRAEGSGPLDVGAPGSSDEPPRQSREQLCSSKSMAIELSGVKHISPIIFYGSPHGAPVKNPSRLLQLLHEIRVDLNEQDKFSPGEEVWDTFPRQEEAVRFAKTHAQVQLFSYQDHLNGQRRFLVCTYEEFWRRYEKMDSRVRHHYEVIQEGLPCHLYFDLEFNKRDNPERNADEVVDILVSVTFQVLFDKYSIQGNHDWIVELDSSTEDKFSRHLIIRIPQTAFKDNTHVGAFVSETNSPVIYLYAFVDKFSCHLIIRIPQTTFKDNTHVGAFVSEICSWICSAHGKDFKLDKLYIRKDAGTADSSSQLFLDTAVYSRNRCFRLVFSSKAGKNSVLLPTRRFRCKNMGDKDIFMESLICRMDMDCKKLLVCKLDIDCKKRLLFDFEVNGDQRQRHEALQNATRLDCAENFTGAYFTGISPFPTLDSFIETIASMGNTLGKIRRWYWFSAFGLMVYSMSRSRYCERIGREHKSNHVMYIVEFRSGIYYQKCYDPDCKGYRSPFRPLPNNVIPDGMAFSTLRQRENYRNVLNVESHHDEGSLEEGSFDNSEWITDSCKRNRGWWQEAIQYADHIENMREIPESCNQGNEQEEDCNWWMDVGNFILDVEESMTVERQ